MNPKAAETWNFALAKLAKGKQYIEVGQEEPAKTELAKAIYVERGRFSTCSGRVRRNRRRMRRLKASSTTWPAKTVLPSMPISPQPESSRRSLNCRRKRTACPPRDHDRIARPKYFTSPPCQLPRFVVENGLMKRKEKQEIDAAGFVSRPDGRLSSGVASADTNAALQEDAETRTGCVGNGIAEEPNPRRWLLRNTDLLMLAALAVVVMGTWAVIELTDAVLEGSTQRYDDRVLASLRSPTDWTQPMGPAWFAAMWTDISAWGAVRS